MSIFEESRNWTFVADMDLSGSVTIMDTWLWVKWLFFYPGDIAVFIFSKFPSEIGELFVYGGFISFFLSCFLWWWVVKVFKLDYE